jgi:small-conductance mechanosensitive channel
VGVVAALGKLGVKLTGLLTAAGIFTVALGFAAQTSSSNVISGVFLLIDRPFSINDTVKIDDSCEETRTESDRDDLCEVEVV